MIDLKTWKPAVMTTLKAAFGERLLCLGLQGSYLRGEATADSDIDLLVVLDQVTIDDLDAFHAAMRSLPDGERAVGFTCGRAELAAWPAYELYQFEHGPRSGWAIFTPCCRSMTRMTSVWVPGSASPTCTTWSTTPI